MKRGTRIRETEDEEEVKLGTLPHHMTRPTQRCGKSGGRDRGRKMSRERDGGWRWVQGLRGRGEKQRTAREKKRRGHGEGHRAR
jgi:hypothetical protein